MSLVVQTIMRLLGKAGDRHCVSCGRGYRPGPGDRGYCPRCEPEHKADKDKAGDSGKPFRED